MWERFSQYWLNDKGVIGELAVVTTEEVLDENVQELRLQEAHHELDLGELVQLSCQVEQLLCK